MHTEKVPEDVSWSHFIHIWENFFQSFRTKFFIALHDMIGVQNFPLSFLPILIQIMMCNFHWCYT